MLVPQECIFAVAGQSTGLHKILGCSVASTAV
jgi:hypothetical protein